MKQRIDLAQQEKRLDEPTARASPGFATSLEAVSINIRLFFGVLMGLIFMVRNVRCGDCNSSKQFNNKIKKNSSKNKSNNKSLCRQRRRTSSRSSSLSMRRALMSLQRYHRNNSNNNSNNSNNNSNNNINKKSKLLLINRRSFNSCNRSVSIVVMNFFVN